MSRLNPEMIVNRCALIGYRLQRYLTLFGQIDLVPLYQGAVRFGPVPRVETP
jgi:hypothetical protein